MELNNDLIGDLTNPAPVERVITEDSAKTFNITGDLFILDSLGGIDYTKSKVIINNPVPVFNDEKKLIGSAVVNVEGHVISSELFLDYSTPERLNIETKSTPMYPHMDCSSSGIYVGSVAVCEELKVESVTLLLSPTEDDRILPL